MAPRAHEPVVDGLLCGAARGAGQAVITAGDLEINAALAGVEHDVLHLPRWLKTQGAREQCFDSNAHLKTLSEDSARWACGQADKRPDHMPTRLYHHRL